MTERFCMPPLSLNEILRTLAPGMEIPWAGSISVCEVCIDSRHAMPGSLFVALKGERTDGHAYVPQALAAGARLALVERAIEGIPIIDTLQGTWPATPPPALAIRTANTLGALQALARARRLQRPDLTVIGITGSVGKTTVKEAVAAVLAERGPVLKTTGNHNNEIGLPLTVMTLSDQQYAVLEMGMYALGEIATLCEIALPRLGIITSIAPVHLERLGTMERIAQAKAELVQALPPDGTAVLNADDPRVAAMASQTKARVITYGASPNADVTLENVESLGIDGNVITVHASENGPWNPASFTGKVRVNVPGLPGVMAALPAVAVGLLEGLEWEEIDKGLAHAERLRLVQKQGQGGITLLDDSYNSSPPSAIAALDLLSTLPQRRIAVLGDMLELGDLEVQGHQQVGAKAATACDILITIGSRAKIIAHAAREAGLAPERIHMTENVSQALTCLKTFLQEGDVVLVKASRSMQLETLVQALEVKAQ